jgi:hypothetical protein
MQVQAEATMEGESPTMPLSRPMVKTGGRWAFMALSGGRWGASQRFVLAVLCSLVVVGGAAVLHLGAEAVGHWWETTTLVQRTAPLYMISLLPYLDFLNKLQQSKPQATNLMVQSFAGVLVFVVISTPVELYARVQLGRDVADVDPLHFGVQVCERM